MRQIAKWEAKDGREFVLKSDCEAYEKLCVEVDALIATLKPRPDLPGCRFENGAGYIQQERGAVLDFQRAITRIAKRSFTSDEFAGHFDFAMNADKPVGYTMVGRLIDEGCPRPVGKAWQRIMCMDSRFREWGQPYYTNHPEKAEQVELG